MKSLIRTYVDPKLDDRLKLLAESTGASLSSLAAELIHKGLESDSVSSVDMSQIRWLEESLYLQFLTLQVVLDSSSIESEQFAVLKDQARHWAEKKCSKFNGQG